MKTKFQGHWGAIWHVAIWCFGAMLQSQNAVSAQNYPDTSSEKLWQQLQDADTRIHSCRVTWRRVLSVKANPKLNVEKRIAQAAEHVRLTGGSEKDVHAAAEKARQLAQEDVAGRQVISNLSFVRDGSTVRCEIETNFGGGGKTPPKRTKTFDFYDGKNSISGEQEVLGVKVPLNAYLVRDEKEVLSRSAATWQTPRFLIGLPLAQKLTNINPPFSPQDTSWQPGPANTLVLEKKNKPETGISGIEYPGVLRLTVSKEHFRPVSYELTNLLYEEEGGKVMGRVDISGYQRYADDIWFPSKVTVSTSAYSMDYTLVQVAFNEAVDPMEVRLPAGMRIADARFGEKKTVIYQLKNGLLPSDDEVRHMLGEKVEKGKAESNAKAANLEIGSKKGLTLFSSLPVTPIIGILLMTCGCMLWGRSRHIGGDS